jgi:hypothetical protein
MGIHGSQKMDKNEDGKFTWRNSIDGDGADGFSKITPFSDIMSEQLMEVCSFSIKSLV